MSTLFSNIIKGLSEKGYSLEEIGNALDGYGDKQDEIVALEDEAREARIAEFHTLDDGFFIRQEGKAPRPDFWGLAEYFRDILLVKYNKIESYIYEENYYRPISIDEMAYKVGVLTQDRSTPTQIGHFVNAIKAKCYSNDFNTLKRGYINLNNGVFSIKDRKLLDHSPTFNFRYKLSHDFEPEAKCPAFKAWLLSNLDDERLVDLVFEIFGYCLEGSDQYMQKAFVFTGRPSTGKSTLLKVLSYLLGHANIGAVSLDKLSGRFDLVTLKDKLINIVEEIPDQAANAEIFKSIIGGGEILVEQKNKPAFTTTIDAKFVLGANGFIKFRNAAYSKALARRLIYIPFDKVVDDKDKIYDFHTHFYPEMSGILNESLLGLDRLKKSRKFSTTAVTDKLLEDFTRDVDSCYNWFKENLTIKVTCDARHSFNDLYRFYRADTNNDGRIAVKKSEFYTRLRTYLDDQKGWSGGELMGVSKGYEKTKFVEFKQLVDNNSHLRGDKLW